MHLNFAIILGKISGIETLNKIKTHLDYSRFGYDSFPTYMIMYVIKLSALLIPAFISYRILFPVKYNIIGMIKLVVCVVLIRFIYLEIIKLFIVSTVKNKNIKN